MPANRPQDAGAPKKTKRADQRPPSWQIPKPKPRRTFRATLVQAGCLRSARKIRALPLDQLAAATLEISGFLFKPSGLLAASTLTACKLGASMTFSLRSIFAGFSVAAFC